MPAPTWNLKSSKVGADMTLAGRPFQKRIADRKKDPLMALMEQYIGGNRWWCSLVATPVLSDIGQ